MKAMLMIRLMSVRVPVFLFRRGSDRQAFSTQGQPAFRPRYSEFFVPAQSGCAAPDQAGSPSILTTTLPRLWPDPARAWAAAIRSKGSTAPTTGW